MAGSSGHHTSDPHRFIESDSLCVEITVEEVPYASNVIAAEATQASAARSCVRLAGSERPFNSGHRRPNTTTCGTVATIRLKNQRPHGEYRETRGKELTRRPALAFVYILATVTEIPQPPALYTTLEKHLTSMRLSPFVAATKGNFKSAVQLYHWNLSLSGAAYETLHMFEVVLRNAIDRELCAWNGRQLNAVRQPHSSDWLVDPSRLLQRLVGLDDIERARERARRATRAKKRNMLHADVLAQITFGTWRFLLPDKDPGRQLLWRDALAFAFPNLDCTPQELTERVTGINELRNRVAHLEPLLNSTSVRNQFNNMRAVLKCIDARAEGWFVSNQRVTAALRTRPVT